MCSPKEKDMNKDVNRLPFYIEAIVFWLVFCSSLCLNLPSVNKCYFCSKRRKINKTEQVP